ncbi:hypothetical protein BE221DRAFT_164398, partial [Ostreococcus tauri]
MCGEDAFYKIHYANWKSMHNERVHDEMIHDSRAYGDHVWNKLSHGRVKMVPKQSVNALDERTQMIRMNRTYVQKVPPSVSQSSGVNSQTPRCDASQSGRVFGRFKEVRFQLDLAGATMMDLRYDHLEDSCELLL